MVRPIVEFLHQPEYLRLGWPAAIAPDAIRTAGAMAYLVPRERLGQDYFRGCAYPDETAVQWFGALHGESAMQHGRRRCAT